MKAYGFEFEGVEDIKTGLEAAKEELFEAFKELKKTKEFKKLEKQFEKDPQKIDYDLGLEVSKIFCGFVTKNEWVIVWARGEYGDGCFNCALCNLSQYSNLVHGSIPHFKFGVDGDVFGDDNYFERIEESCVSLLGEMDEED